MKRKSILLAAVGASVGAVAIAAAVAANLDTPELEMPAVRVAVDPMEAPTGEGMFVPGNAVYVSVNHNWLSDNAKFAVYFFTEEHITYEWTDIMTEVEGFIVDPWDDGQSFSLYEAVVPAYEGVTEWYGCIAVRLSAAATEGSWDNKWNQTSEILAEGITDKTQNNIVVTDLAGDNCYKELRAVAPADRIVVWAGTTGWWGETNNICKPDGSTDREALETAWTSSAESFGKLGYDVKAYFSNFEQKVAPEEGDHLVNNVADQYDGIITKYTEFNNFALRTPVHHY